MPKNIWRHSELKVLLENFDKTTDELIYLLPGRSRKAINRKIEKLRDREQLGYRSERTKKRAYRQRGRSRLDKVEKEHKFIEDDYVPVDEEE